MIDPTIEQALAPSKEDWREPLWAKFKAFCWGFGKAAALIALFLAGVALYQGYKNHSATVEAIQNPPSGSPEIGASSVTGIPATKQKVIKSAPKKIANEAINTAASDGFYGLKPHEKPPEKQAKKPKIKDDFTAEFDREQIKFETNLKKEFP